MHRKTASFCSSTATRCNRWWTVWYSALSVGDVYSYFLKATRCVSWWRASKNNRRLFIHLFLWQTSALVGGLHKSQSKCFSAGYVFLDSLTPCGSSVSVPVCVCGFQGYARRNLNAHKRTSWKKWMCLTCERGKWGQWWIPICVLWISYSWN